MSMRSWGFGALAAGVAACTAGENPPAARQPAAADGASRAAPVPAAPADTAPYMIIEPVAGTLWREGEVHMIRWRAQRAGSVNIGAVMGGKDKGHLAFALPAAADSFAWKIPAGFVTGFGIARSDAVRLRVEDAGDPAVGVESAPFTIAGSP